MPRSVMNRVVVPHGMAAKQRLDLELVSRGLVASRQQAQQLIRAGKVRDGAGEKRAAE